MFRQIYELTVLGMHPATLYPRRSQIRPLRRIACISIVRPEPDGRRRGRLRRGGRAAVVVPVSRAGLLMPLVMVAAPEPHVAFAGRLNRWFAARRAAAFGRRRTRRRPAVAPTFGTVFRCHGSSPRKIAKRMPRRGERIKRRSYGRTCTPSSAAVMARLATTPATMRPTAKKFAAAGDVPRARRTFRAPHATCAKRKIGPTK